MKIRLVHPDTAIINGNVVTCRRWKRSWQHNVVIQSLSQFQIDDHSFDVTVVLHAYKCANIVDSDTILVLSGTDLSLWCDIANASALRAKVVVCLRPLGLDEYCPVVPRCIPQGRPRSLRIPGPMIPGMMTVLVVANSRPEKGVETLLRAAEMLPQGIIVIIAGSGYYPSSKNVVHIGEIPEYRASECIRRTDVLVCPSVSEGLSDVFVQGVRGGVPMLCTRIPATTWILPCYSGMFEVGDSTELASLILRCMVSWRYRHRLSTELQTVSDTLSEHQECRSWHNILEQNKKADIRDHHYKGQQGTTSDGCIPGTSVGPGLINNPKKINISKRSGRCKGRKRRTVQSLPGHHRDPSQCPQFLSQAQSNTRRSGRWFEHRSHVATIFEDNRTEDTTKNDPPQ